MPSYQDKKWSIDISEAFAGANNKNANNSFDDNEVSEWRNDGKLSTAFITYKFKEKQVVDEVSLKLGNWRTKSYPIEIIADNQVIFSGNTPTSLGYVHLKTKPTLTDNITVR